MQSEKECSERQSSALRWSQARTSIARGSRRRAKKESENASDARLLMLGGG
jgi:hypothetical protein